MRPLHPTRALTANDAPPSNEVARRHPARMQRKHKPAQGESPRAADEVLGVTPEEDADGRAEDGGDDAGEGVESACERGGRRGGRGRQGRLDAVERG